MSWYECEKVLITLSQRQGNEYNRGWYSQEWEDVYTRNPKVYCKCLICYERFFYADRYNHSESQMKISAKEHGMKHLKESNLLPFM
jgi:hypothetical protein